MLVSRKHKALVLRLKDPNRVTSVIPSARVFQHNGKEFVAVKHGPDETKVLRNIGLDAPSPILYHYDWPGQFRPFEHQKDTAGFMCLENRAFNLNGMGTGKTLATLWAYDYLRSRRAVRKAMVITPLSTLERTWADEVFDHFPHLDTVVLYGSRDRRLKLLDQDVDIYLINHDGIKVNGFVEAMAQRPDIDLLIIDELAQVARNAGTDRFNALRDISNKQHPRRVWGLTGTPMPNGPTDVWAQCRLLVPERVPVYFNKFRDQVERQVNQFLWVPRENALDVVHDAMQPSIRYSLEECIDLPECIYETRTAQLTKEQAEAYKDMLQHLCIEAANGDVTAANEAVKAQKLIQVACGAAYIDEDTIADFDAGPRMEVLMEIIEQAGAKVIVFAPFRSAVTKIAHEVSYQLDKADFTKGQLAGRKHGYKVEVIHGGVGKSERDRILGAFQQDADPKVLVAQPGTMSHGLNLTAANTIIWYAPISSNDIFQQANARVRRPGQKHTQLIVMIEGTPVERKYYARLKDKERVQGILLDMVQEARVTA